MEKSNTEHLRNLIDKVLIYDIKLKDEINEFVDAIDTEIADLNDDIKNLQEENLSKDSEISDLELKIEEHESYDFETIDCGVGIIEYVEPDNLRLQLLMQEFKERQESILQK